MARGGRVGVSGASPSTPMRGSVVACGGAGPLNKEIPNKGRGFNKANINGEAILFTYCTDF